MQLRRTLQEICAKLNALFQHFELFGVISICSRGFAFCCCRCLIGFLLSVMGWYNTRVLIVETSLATQGLPLWGINIEKLITDMVSGTITVSIRVNKTCHTTLREWYVHMPFNTPVFYSHCTWLWNVLSKSITIVERSQLWCLLMVLSGLMSQNGPKRLCNQMCILNWVAVLVRMEVMALIRRSSPALMVAPHK